MSCCRWGPDSDVYVYEDSRGGWTTEVAGKERASFRDTTPGACADRLEGLLALGRRIPQAAIDELRAEQAGRDE